MTLSLLARCPDTQQFGMVIASSSPAVAARCSHARAGVGVAASQNITDPALGPALLDYLARGMHADPAMQAIVAATPHIAYRQLMLVDAQGGTAFHMGTGMLGIFAVAQAHGVIAGGNLLANDRVPQAMLDGFAASSVPFGSRLIAALKAGRDAGGEAGPLHSAGLIIVDKLTWPIADLRCDWTEDCPIDALAKAWDAYHPQMHAYVERAQNPSFAPSYGVPGDP
jgi:uncharacterized Ntn-hydrolase superfamily protein